MDELCPMEETKPPEPTTSFNPKPLVKVSLEGYDSWCREWRLTLIVKLLGTKNRLAVHVFQVAIPIGPSGSGASLGYE